MVWCHGGGFATGSGSSPITEGEALARRGDVVVVTLNHRLNVMGFTFLEEAGGAEFAGSGDAGMLDIVHALSGCATTSAASAAIRATSPCSASRAAAARWRRCWRCRRRRASSTAPSSRAAPR